MNSSDMPSPSSPSNAASRPTLYHIPVCPFSQRLEILLALKDRPDAVAFSTVDITRPRDPALLELTGGSTALPVMDTGDGPGLKESLVILRYLDETVGQPVRQADPRAHAIEGMLIAKEGPLTIAGYRMVMNQDQAAREGFAQALLAQYAALDAFLRRHAPEGPFLFDRFGLAEAVFTPIFARFWFLDYYEGFDLPQGPDFARLRTWREACLSHPAAGQVSREEVVKTYYDYALGAGNGALPKGRRVSSFAFEPHWKDRPWPPRDKWSARPSDAELGLVAG